MRYVSSFMPRDDCIEDGRWERDCGLLTCGVNRCASCARKPICRNPTNRKEMRTRLPGARIISSVSMICFAGSTRLRLKIEVEMVSKRK